MKDKKYLQVGNNDELIIDENTKLMSVRDKDKYIKLVINKKINPIFLSSFKNVKELTLNKVYYNEERLDKLVFKDNIEKLVINNISMLGMRESNSGTGILSYDKYRLPFPKLKILEFPEILYNVNPYYLNNTNKLETMIFNISVRTKLDLTWGSHNEPVILPSSLKNIVIKTILNTFEVHFDYTPKYLSKVYFNSYGLIMEFYNKNIISRIKIVNNKLHITNTLRNIADEMVKDKYLYIPDYINDINLEGRTTIKEIDTISINLKSLNLSNIITHRPLNKYLFNIKKIIIRTNKEMKLKPTIEFTTNEYGDIKDMYIKDNKLQIIFSKQLFIIDDDGNIEKQNIVSHQIKEDKIKISENNDVSKGCRPYFDEININKYSSKQLEYYSYFKKLLELFEYSEDKEVKDAMNVVQKKLIRILDIDSKEN